MNYHEPNAKARMGEENDPGSQTIFRHCFYEGFRYHAGMNSFPRVLTVLTLATILGGAPGCSMMQRRTTSTSPAQVGNVGYSDQTGAGQLTTHRAGDHERVLRMGRDVLREKGLVDKYDISSATAFERKDHWEVCFTPKSGIAKNLRKKCFNFPF